MITVVIKRKTLASYPSELTLSPGTQTGTEPLFPSDPWDTKLAAELSEASWSHAVLTRWVSPHQVKVQFTSASSSTQPSCTAWLHPSCWKDPCGTTCRLFVSCLEVITLSVGVLALAPSAQISYKLLGTRAWVSSLQLHSSLLPSLLPFFRSSQALSHNANLST